MDCKTSCLCLFGLTVFSRIVTKLGYTYLKASGDKRIETFLELFLSIQLLASRMATGMIASCPILPSEEGRASSLLHSDLFSGAISPHVEHRMHANARSTSDPRPNSLYKYTITVSSHEPLGLWLGDPPEGIIQERGKFMDCFAPTVIGFRRVGSSRGVGPLEKDGRVLIGHRLVSVSSAANNGILITQFNSVEEAYDALRLARRPVTLEFATLSTISELSFSDQLQDVDRYVKLVTSNLAVMRLMWTAKHQMHLSIL